MKQKANLSGRIQYLCIRYISTLQAWQGMRMTDKKHRIAIRFEDIYRFASLSIRYSGPLAVCREDRWKGKRTNEDMWRPDVRI